MPLSFLNPALLFGTAAAALPVIIHFLSRRRVTRKKFSDLRFLDEVQARQARSLGIRRWLLLLLRMLAIALVALAAAGPRWGGLGAVGGTRSVLFVVDTSASMNTRLDEGTRLTTAITAVEDMIRSLPAESAVQVMTSGSRTGSLFGDWLPAGAGARGGLERVGPTDGAFDLAAVVREASRQVVRAPGSPVEIVVLSDLQVAPWTDDLVPAAERLKNAGGARFLVRQVGEAVPGGGITEVILPQRALRPGESVTLSARVLAEYKDQVFALELDGATVAEAVAIASGATEILEFPLTVPARGLHRGSLRKEGDVFTGDDVRPFVLTVPPTVRVLVVHGEDRPVDPAAGRGGWRYLAEALAPGEGPSPFSVRAVATGDLTTGDMGASDVVALVDTGPLGRRTLEGLTRWLNDGGTALVLAGDPSQAANLTGNLLPALGRTGGAEFRISAAPGQRVRIVDPAHPVFAGLDPEALSTFTDIPWRRWFALESPEESSLLVLAGGDPIFLTGKLGDGAYALLPWNLGPEGSDLAVSPMALPFLQRTISWLAAHAGPGRAVNTIVGREAVIMPRSDGPAEGLDRPEDLALIGPTGEADKAVTLEWRGGQPRLRAGVIDRAGFHTFTATIDTLGLVAAGIPAGESVLELASIPDWSRQMEAHDLDVAGDLTGTLPASFLEALGGRNLAPWLLFLAVVLLMFELALGRGARSSS
jgi:hypothetical protein